MDRKYEEIKWLLISPLEKHGTSFVFHTNRSWFKTATEWWVLV